MKTPVLPCESYYDNDVLMTEVRLQKIWFTPSPKGDKILPVCKKKNNSKYEYCYNNGRWRP